MMRYLTYALKSAPAVLTFATATTLVFALFAKPAHSITWPTTWTSVGACAESEPAGDVSPNTVELVGATGQSAAYLAIDNDYLYIRERVQQDPSSGGGFANVAWVVLLQIPGGDPFKYQFLISLNGGGETVELWENDQATGTNVLFNPVFSDQAETLRYSDTSANLARFVAAGTTIGGDANYFVDWAMPLSVLDSWGIDATNSLFFFATSANSSNYNKDILECAFTPQTALSLDKTVSPTSIGVNAVTPVTYTLVVTNDGPPTASGVVVLDDGFPGWLTITNVTSTAGTSSFTASSFQVQIPSLAALASVTITVNATASPNSQMTFVNEAIAFATNANIVADAATLTVAQPPTATPTTTSTATATATATDTAVLTETNTPIPTDTNPPVPTSTDTPIPTATATDTPVFTYTETAGTCGDGNVDADEVCDDGNLFNGDGCENNCTVSAQCNFSHAGVRTEIFVNDSPLNDGVGTPLGCVTALFTSIQAAIDAITTSDGDMIRVCPGSYTESVVVDKELSIESTGGEASTFINSAGIAFDVQRSAVTIQGFTIEAANAAVGASSICPIGQSSCGTARGSNLTVRDNTIQNSPLGIGWTSSVSCALIELNTMNANAAHIDIDQQGGPAAIATRVSQNNLTGGGGSGKAVRLSGTGLLTLFVGNTVDGSAGDGLVLSSLPSGGLIEENNIRNSAGSGALVLPGAATARIQQNNIADNGIGLTNQAPEGAVNATLNWWDSQTGPFHASKRVSAVGDEIIESGGGFDTLFIEFLCGPAPGGFPSDNGECSGAEPEGELNFVAFGHSPDVAPNGRFIVFVSDHDLNSDAIVAADNVEGGEEVFLLNRKPHGKPHSFCLGGTTPGASCRKHRECLADFNADPIVNEGVCVLLTQLTDDVTGTASAAVPRVTRSGMVFFSDNADLFGTNTDSSAEIHSWSRRTFRKQKPADPNVAVTMLTDGAGLDSLRPGPDRGGRRRLFVQTNADPLGTNADGNFEIMLLDLKSNAWTQVTNSTGADNLRPATQNGRQVVFDSEADLIGQNPDGNREIFEAVFKRRDWVITQITDTVGVENRAGSLAKAGKVLTFSSNGDFVGQNADGNREIFVWEKGVFEQITHSTVGECANPQANPRGRFVVFESTADVEDGGTGNILTNRRVHLYDRVKGRTLLLSRSFFGDNFVPRISQGRFVVWESTANLTGRNPDGERSIYLFDRRKEN